MLGNTFYIVSRTGVLVGAALLCPDCNYIHYGMGVLLGISVAYLVGMAESGKMGVSMVK